MTDEDTPNRVLHLSFENWGRIVALEIMMRAVIAKWAAENNNPLDFLDTMRRDLVNSMNMQGRDDDALEAFLIQHAEHQINDTFENLRLRFSEG